MQAMAAAIVLAAVHLSAGHLRGLDRVPRNRWLSAAGGLSLAYVFVHLLPELAAVQRAVEETAGLDRLEHQTYLVALVGIATFYALEQLARRSKRRSRGPHTPDEVGWLHIGSYTLYNAIIGYLLQERAADGGASLWLFAFAMGVHFVVNDHGLRSDHGPLYHRVGRWLVSAGVLLGWAASRVMSLGETALGLPLAFLAGGVILNVLKEELPEDRESRLLPFAAAAAGYAALLVVV